MSTPITTDAIVRQLTTEFVRVWSARLGGEAATAPSTEAQGIGWLIAMPIGGAIVARAIVWIDREAAAGCTKTALALDRPPEEQEIATFLKELVAEAASAVGEHPEFTGIYWGEAAVKLGAAIPSLTVSYLAIANVASCVVGIAVELTAGPISSAVDARLDAVLDVDLPLIVRFGRAVMPLKAIADLGPGSVVDMGRSPDEPVELLVGERVIARGEVVVVSGNYGVRITELSGSRQGTSDIEARFS